MPIINLDSGTSSSGGGLSSDFKSTSQFSAVQGSVLFSCDTLTGIGSSGAQTAPALDAGIKTTGTGSVKAVLWTNSASYSKLYANITATPVGTHKYVGLDFNWLKTGPGLGPVGVVFSDRFQIVVADGPDLTGNRSVAPLPTTPGGGTSKSFAAAFVSVGALTSIQSIGIEGISYNNSTTYRTNVWIDNVRFPNETQFDKAMESSPTATVLVPAGYTPTYPQDMPVQPGVGQSVLDMRPTSSGVSRTLATRRISEWGVDKTGATDVTAELNNIFAEVPDRTKLVFDADGRYLVDVGLQASGKTGLDIDLNGSSWIMATRSNAPTFLITECADFTWGNGRFFGWIATVRNGSTMITLAGSPTTVSTTKTLTAAADALRTPKTSASLDEYYSQDADGRFTFDVVLSDSAQVANDCTVKIIAVDPTDTTVTHTVATWTQTLTATPTEYTFQAAAALWLEYPLYLSVTKATATTNTITVTSYTEHGASSYVSAYDVASAIDIESSGDVLIHDAWIEGFGGDGVQVSDASVRGVTVKNVTSRACGRQGMSFNQGENIVVEDCVIGATGRSGIDVEPYALNWTTKTVTLRGIRFYGIYNYAFAIANWSRVYDLTIEDCHCRVARLGFMSGGAIGGRISNVSMRYGSEASMIINGINLDLSNFEFDGNLSYATSTKDRDIGAGTVVESPTNITIHDGRCSGYLTSGQLGVGHRVWGVKHAGTAPDSTFVTGAVLSTTGTTIDGIGLVEEAVYPRSITGPASTRPPHVLGGFDLTDQAMTGVRSLGGAKPQTVSLFTSQVMTAGGTFTSGSVDLGARGRTGRVRVYVTARSAGTNDAAAPLTISTSQNGTNWVTLCSTRSFSALRQIDFVDIRFADRYLKLDGIIGGTAGTITLSADFSYQVRGVNLSGVATPVTTSATSAIVTFPTRVAPAISSFSAAASTGGTLTTGTYYYRVGARSRSAGPATWLTEQSATVDGSSTTSVRLTLGEWASGRNGVLTEGFTVLRGTSSGIYTDRFDVLPLPNTLMFGRRNDSSLWTDTGSTIVPVTSSDWPGFGITYPTISPTLTVGDESGLEPDTAFGVIITPSWATTAHVSAKTTAGFTVTFGSAAPSGGTFDWFLVR